MVQRITAGDIEYRPLGEMGSGDSRQQWPGSRIMSQRVIKVECEAFRTRGNSARSTKSFLEKFYQAEGN